MHQLEEFFKTVPDCKYFTIFKLKINKMLIVIQLRKQVPLKNVCVFFFLDLDVWASVCAEFDSWRLFLRLSA